MSFTTPRTTCAIRALSPAINQIAMGTFRSIVFSSVIAGFTVGLIVTVLQQFGTGPLILNAEAFAKAVEAHQRAHAAGSPQGTGASGSHSHQSHPAEPTRP